MVLPIFCTFSYWKGQGTKALLQIPCSGLMTVAWRPTENMKRKKIAILVIGSVLLGVAVLRETGAIDASVYKSNLSVSQTTTKSDTYSGDEKHFSYHLTIKHTNQTLQSQTYSYNNLLPIEIEATLEDPVYSGNCILPLIKNFKMAYQCEFTTVGPSSEHKIKGKIQGEVTAVIHGLCSRRKAKELAFEEAKKQIISYFQ